MKRCPYRIWIGIMIFAVTALNYSYRTFFQISLVAMLDRQTPDNKTLPDYGPRYNYTSWQEGLVIGAFYYGQTISSLPGGPIAEYAGPRTSVAGSLIISAIITLITPFVVMNSWIPLFICRLLVGIIAGVQYPALLCLIGRWAPPHEKGKFTACLMGNVFGAFLTNAATGGVVDWLGWKASFFFMAGASILFGLIYFILVSDYPDRSYFCTKEEIDFIEASHEGAIDQKKMMPPFLKMAKSCPYIALIIGQFGSVWGLNLIVTSMPKFMDEVLNFNLKEIGLFASLPSVARLLTGFMFGSISDALLRRKIVTNKSIVRKGFMLFSHLLPGMFLCLYTVIGNNAALAITFLVLMLAFNGASVATMLINAQDLAPNFAGTMYGIMNFFASTTGFIIPAINSKILEEKSDWGEWTIIFIIGGIMYIATGLQFIIFGSTKLQPWNEKPGSEEDVLGEILDM